MQLMRQFVHSCYRQQFMMDAQAGQHGSTAHAQGLSHSKGDADDCNIIR